MKKKKQLKIKEKKQVDALEKLKPKEETKPIEDKPNNHSRAAIIIITLLTKEKN